MSQLPPDPASLKKPQPEPQAPVRRAYKHFAMCDNVTGRVKKRYLATVVPERENRGGHTWCEVPAEYHQDLMKNMNSFLFPVGESPRRLQEVQFSVGSTVLPADGKSQMSVRVRGTGQRGPIKMEVNGRSVDFFDGVPQLVGPADEPDLFWVIELVDDRYWAPSMKITIRSAEVIEDPLDQGPLLDDGGA